MTDKDFFAESREQSQVKARIVTKYFWAWATVMMPTAKIYSKRIAYIDLFSGPGRYEDGTVSTPLMVLEKAIADPQMSTMLVTLFNDRDAENVGKLKAAIESLPGIEKLKYKPEITNEIVGEELAKKWAAMRFVPTFFFIDPWGYAGLSSGLIKAVIQSWGCDCVFFFNYNRINMGLANDKVQAHMDALFGAERANQLRQILPTLEPTDRENQIVEALAEAMKQLGAPYVLPFAFKDTRGNRTKHHLIFVTKHFKGYEIMKGIMAKESSEQNQGVATFEFSPAAERFPLLFELSRPLDELGQMLLKQFAGETLTMRHIYERHSVGRPYISSNYKDVLKVLEKEQKIKAIPPAEDRPKNTFADNVQVFFPKQLP